MRDRHGWGDRFSGANLVFGAYDLSTTPSAMGIGVTTDTDMLDPEDMRFMLEQFLPGMSVDERRDPDVSPMYADLRAMPPALFTVGTADHLVDDTLFFANRWVLAGQPSRVARVSRCSPRVHRGRHGPGPLVAASSSAS